MKLVSVHIENYRCVYDSTVFTIDPMTCLVGKNESGKTSLLQALYKIKPAEDKGNFDALSDYPRKDYIDYKKKEQPANVLTTVWELTPTKLTEVEAAFGEKILDDNQIVIKKGYDNINYWEIPINEKAALSHILGQHIELLSTESIFSSIETISDLIAKVDEQVAKFETDNVSDSSEEKTIESLKTLQTKLQKEYSAENLHQQVQLMLKKYLPTFVYFSQYYAMPGRVSINDLKKKKQKNQLTQNDKIFIALLSLAGTTPESIEEITQYEELTAELEAVSSRLSREIFEYWSQNRHLKVNFRYDFSKPSDPAPFNEGYVFTTRIENTHHDVTVPFDERSTGFVWFFSFLVWLSQIKETYEENLIILLDEPALNLHAKAQADLLRYIKEKLVPNYQVIYTTHSPFMVDAENILTARTVEDVFKDEQSLGTKVSGEVLSTDPDTIHPLQAALGYDITQGLFVGKHTLLVEGPSDYLYLKWFSHELKKLKRTCLDPRWVICPCGGIDKIVSFVALFGGQKLNIAVLADFADGQKKKVRQIFEKRLLQEAQVFTANMYANQLDADIEDIIGRPFYMSLINSCYDLQGDAVMPIEKAHDAPLQVVDEVALNFDKSVNITDTFDHYTPASYLLELGGEAQSMDGFEDALGNFEKMFADINALLPIN